MAQKTQIEIAIDAKIADSQTLTDVRAITKAVRELQALALQTGDATSEAYLKATAAAGELRDSVADVNANMKAISGEPIERLSNSFSQVTSSLANLDFDQATAGVSVFTNTLKEFNVDDLKKKIGDFQASVKKAGEELTDKLGPKGQANVKGFSNLLGGLGQTATSALSGNFTGAIKGVGQSFQGLGQIIKANPILALAGVVALIVTNFDKLVSAGGVVGKVFGFIGDIVKSVTGIFVTLSDAIGLTNIKGAERSKEVIANLEKEEQSMKDRYDLEIELANIAGKNTLDLERQKEVETRNLNKKKVEDLRNLEKTNHELTEDQKKDLESYEKAFQTAANNIIKIDAKKTKELIDNANKIYDEGNRIAILGIKDERQRKLAQNVSDRSAAIEEADKQFKDNKQNLERRGQIFEEYRIKEQEINKEYNDKDQQAAEKAAQNAKRKRDEGAKAVIDATKKEKEDATKRLEEIQNQGELIIANDQKVSAKRFELLQTNLLTQIQFIEQNEKKLYGVEGGAKAELDIQNILNRIAASRKEVADREIAIEKEKQDKLKEQRDKEQEAYLASRDTRLQNESDELQSEARLAAANGNRLDERLKYIQHVSEFEKTERLARYQDEVANAIAHGGNLESINRKYLNDEVAADKEAQRAKIAAATAAVQEKLAIASSFTGAVSALNDLITQNEERGLKKGEKVSLEIQKKQFRRQKALKLVEAVISTATGVTAQLSAGPPVGFILAALAAATGAIQIAAIAKSQFNPDSDSSGGGAATSTPVLGNSAAAASAAQTPFSAPQLFGIGGGQLASGPDSNSRVYVLESDITRSQGRVTSVRNGALLER